MNCRTCLKWTGQSISHDICPLKESLVCRRCCSRGHSTSECEDNNIWHPTCLEELIPIDIKEKYNITTQTEYIKPPEIEVSPHPTCFLDIINDDKWLREFMKNHHLLTNLYTRMKKVKQKWINMSIVNFCKRYFHLSI